MLMALIIIFSMSCMTQFQLKKEIPDVATAQQFLSSVANSSEVVAQRPTNDPTIESVLLYTLHEEILATARTGLDSGIDLSSIPNQITFNLAIASNSRFFADLVPCWGYWLLYPAALRAATWTLPAAVVTMCLLREL